MIQIETALDKIVNTGIHVTPGDPMFKDRLDAARQLATALRSYQDQHPLVLGIPRGAVPMAQLLAQQLRGEMDVVLVHKLRAPFMPEVAIGAIDETGQVDLTPDAPKLGADGDRLQAEKERQWATLQRRRHAYDAIRQPLDIQGRTVIVVDDGLATGATMVAALQRVRQQHPARLVCAVPVASPDALEKVRPWADDLVCLSAPQNFQGVGQFYQDFRQVSDDDVLNCWRSDRTPQAPAPD
jgi:predicted phosphoribosyltransferase